MIRIDANAYSGSCSCGKEHKMTTKLCIIEPGALLKLDGYLAECGLSGISVAIYDENTRAAVGDRAPRVDYEIVLPAERLHADDEAVAMLAEMLPVEMDYLIALGAGSIHDITRYTAYERGIPFVSCPTAASVDGFCSSVAAMTWHGFKKTLTAVPPTLVVADTDVIKAAPMRLSASGFSDMIGKYICLADWRIGNALTGEYLCERILGITAKATEETLNAATGVSRGDADAYERLTYGLLMSGLAMQMLGNSRCASGAEHHISHLIEMHPEGLGVCSDALHGEKVGVGTLMASRIYHGLRNSTPTFGDYKRAERAYIEAMFGRTLAPDIIAECESDVAEGIGAEAVAAAWDRISDIISDIPTPESLSAIYAELGAPMTLGDIGVSADCEDALLEYSPLVRNRLTLMRLRRGGAVS